MLVTSDGKSWATNRELDALHKTGDYEDYKQPVPKGLVQQSAREFVEQYYEANKDNEGDYEDDIRLWIPKYGGHWISFYTKVDDMLEGVAIHSHTTEWGTGVYEMPWGHVYVTNGGCGECDTIIVRFTSIGNYLEEAFRC